MQHCYYDRCRMVNKLQSALCLETLQTLDQIFSSQIHQKVKQDIFNSKIPARKKYLFTLLTCTNICNCHIQEPDKPMTAQATLLYLDLKNQAPSSIEAILYTCTKKHQAIACTIHHHNKPGENWVERKRLQFPNKFCHRSPIITVWLRQPLQTIMREWMDY